MFAAGSFFVVLSLSPVLPDPSAHPAESRKGCGDEESEDECDEGMVRPQVVQWADQVRPRMIGRCCG